MSARIKIPVRRLEPGLCGHGSRDRYGIRVSARVLRCEILRHARHAAADLPWDAGRREPRHPADQESVAAPVDAAVHDRVEPDGKSRMSLTGLKRRCLILGYVPRSQRVWTASRTMPRPTRTRSPPQAIPESPEKAQTRPTVARLAIGSEQKAGSAIRRRILYQRECRFKNHLKLRGGIHIFDDMVAESRIE